MNSETFVWLGIYDFDINPNELTSRVGLNPTETWSKGGTRLVGPTNKRIAIPTKENAWILESGLQKTSSLNEHLEAIFKMIAPNEDLLLLGEKYRLELGIAIYGPEANQGLNIQKEWLNKMAKLNMDLDIDIYYLSD